MLLLWERDSWVLRHANISHLQRCRFHFVISWRRGGLGASWLWLRHVGNKRIVLGAWVWVVVHSKHIFGIIGILLISRYSYLGPPFLCRVPPTPAPTSFMILPLVINLPKPSLWAKAYPDLTERRDLLPEKGLGSPVSPLCLARAVLWTNRARSVSVGWTSIL